MSILSIVDFQVSLVEESQGLLILSIQFGG